MAHPKRNLFTVLGWIVWKALALVGLPIARKKLDERRSNRSLRRGRR
ncbi:MULTISPECIES: hypothetical protein [unclassified Aeromicrobium]|nr:MULTISPECIES: hypothetical protein [unclassified Aeromicrobium]MBD8606803.1 hypothetical protein [Aeromicrobium sp. CFBP 8757]